MTRRRSDSEIKMYGLVSRIEWMGDGTRTFIDKSLIFICCQHVILVGAILFGNLRSTYSNGSPSTVSRVHGLFDSYWVSRYIPEILSHGSFHARFCRMGFLSLSVCLSVTISFFRSRIDRRVLLSVHRQCVINNHHRQSRRNFPSPLRRWRLDTFDIRKWGPTCSTLPRKIQTRPSLWNAMGRERERGKWLMNWQYYSYALFSLSPVFFKGMIETFSILFYFISNQRPPICLCSWHGFFTQRNLW